MGTVLGYDIPMLLPEEGETGQQGANTYMAIGL